MAAKTPDPEVGDKYGRWTVTRSAGVRGREKAFQVTCDCGQKREVTKGNLVSGRTQSCGCLCRELSGKQSVTHGLSKSPIYAIWNMMRQRCSLPSNRGYKDYGGRGVKVCERWNSFENFYEDMGDPPFIGTSLDRIDANGAYCKDNCRWATRIEQNNNTRKSVRFQVFGETLSMREAAEKYDLKVNTLRNRVYTYGMTVEEAVTKPVLTSSVAATMAGSGGWGRTNKRIDGTKLYASNPESAL